MTPHKSLSTALGCLFALAVSSCQSEKPHLHEEATFTVTSPARSDTELIKRYVAQIRSSQHIEVRALERGYLEGVFVDEGQAIKKGQRMFQIMPALLQAELEKAQAEVEFAQLEYRNTKVLADANVVSANELALNKAKLDKAVAEAALAKVHRDLTEIRAPFDGRMDRFRVRRGSLVEEGELLTTLSDNSRMWAYFNVTEAEYLDLKAHVEREGMAVKLLLANGAMFSHDGKVETIEADFNNETGTIAFRATFENPEGLLRHGETGNVLLTKPLKGALLVPQKATFDVLDKKFVFVVDKDDVVHAREISVSDELPQVFVVAAGLSENDTILLDGLRKVKDGDKIAIRRLAPHDVLSHLEVPAE